MEPWLEDARRQKRWDARVKRRPICVDCGEHILQEVFLPTDEGPLCPGCVERRMVEIRWE